MYDLEAEKSLIGSILLYPDIANDVLNLLDVSHFYKPDHQKVFEAISELHKQGKSLDNTSINSYLRTHFNNISSIILTDIINDVPCGVDYKTHSETIYDNYIKRQLLDKCKEGVSGLKKANVYSVIEDLLSSLNKLSVERVHDETAKDQAREMMEYQKKIRDKDFLHCGFKKYNDAIGGLRGGEFHVIAGRPGAGKSAYIGNIMSRILNVKQDANILIFSLEMQPVEFLNRSFSEQESILYQYVRSGMLNTTAIEKLVKYCSYIADQNLFVCKKPQITPNGIIREIHKRQVLYKKPVDLIMIDNLQLMKDDQKSRTRLDMLTNITAECKYISKRFDVPIIAISHMNRSFEGRTDGIPRLSDLKESGSIEQDADTVSIFVSESEDNKTMYVLKNRSGILAKISYKFEGGYVRFTEI